MFVCQHSNRLECLIVDIYRKKTDYIRFTNHFCPERLIDSNLTVLSCLSSDCLCKCTSLNYFLSNNFTWWLFRFSAKRFGLSHTLVVTALFIHTALNLCASWSYPTDHHSLKTLTCSSFTPCTLSDLQGHH